jgi:hypothetical protein
MHRHVRPFTAIRFPGKHDAAVGQGFGELAKQLLVLPRDAVRVAHLNVRLRGPVVQDAFQQVPSLHLSGDRSGLHHQPHCRRIVDILSSIVGIVEAPPTTSPMHPRGIFNHATRRLRIVSTSSTSSSAKRRHIPPSIQSFSPRPGAALKVPFDETEPFTHFNAAKPRDALRSADLIASIHGGNDGAFRTVLSGYS